MKKENERTREALRLALKLWGLGGQELLDQIVNSAEETKSSQPTKERITP